MMRRIAETSKKFKKLVMLILVVELLLCLGIKEHAYADTYNYGNIFSIADSFKGSYGTLGVGGNTADGGFYHGTEYWHARNRYIDTGVVYNKNKITSITFTSNTGGESSAMRTIYFYISADGSNWYHVASTSAAAYVCGSATISTSQIPISQVRYFRGYNDFCQDTFAISFVYDTAPPSISLSQASTAITNEIATVVTSITDTESGVVTKKWASGNRPTSYFATSGNILSGTTFNVSSNGVYTVYASDRVGNEAVQTITISNIVVVPTLDIPTVSGLIYMGEDITLSDTGTSINQAAYRIFYTTQVMPPAITNGSTPGAGWVDSGIAGSMDVNSSTSISKLILGSSYANVNWTYLTFKVAAASADNIWVSNYSSAYSLSSDPDSYINRVAHNQIIGTNVLSTPDTTVFFDGDVVKYRLEFDVVRPSLITDMKISFDYNFFNEDGVELVSPSTMWLQKMQSNGTFANLKDLSGTLTKESRNRYIVRLGNDNSGNPIIPANGIGRYAIEYTGNIKVTQFQLNSQFLMRNNSEIKIYAGNHTDSDTIETDRPNRKFYVETNVSKQRVIYR